MGIASRRKKAGRAFELLITQIETTLHPRGATVKSPDHLWDHTINGNREVDASVRYVRDGKPYLVTLECRDRSRAAEPAWIEQLSAKRKDLQADLTIGVSAKGFSKSARLKALFHGILLRETKEVTVEEILDAGLSMSRLAVRIKAIQFGFGASKSNLERVILSLDGTPFDALNAVLLEQDGKVPFTVDDFLTKILGVQDLDWPAASADGSEQGLQFDLAPGKYAVMTPDGLEPVNSATLVIEGGVHDADLTLSRGMDYLGDGKAQLSQFQNWTTSFKTLDGETVQLDVELILKPI
jgi:hypothetical protein